MTTKEKTDATVDSSGKRRKVIIVRPGPSITTTDDGLNSCYHCEQTFSSTDLLQEHISTRFENQFVKLLLSC